MINNAREIGFGQEVVVGQRSFYVQTEVISAGTAGLSMRSLVLEGGVVRDSHTAPYPTDAADLVAAEKVVKRQHEDMVKKVWSGKITTT